MRRRVTSVAAVMLSLVGGGHTLVRADDGAPAPIVQPDITGVRVVSAHTTYGQLETDYSSSNIATERVGIDWAIAPSWSAALELPLALATFDCCSDPDIHLKEWVMGNPTLTGRFQRILYSSGESLLQGALSIGAIVPTADDDTDLDVLRVRDQVRMLHLVHHPYDFSDSWPVVPLRGDLRWSANGTAVQLGAAVHTMLEDGGPQVDILLANLGVGHAFSAGVELVADVTLIAIPPEISFEETSASFCPAIDLAGGRRFGPIDVRLTFYVPAPSCHDFSDESGRAVGLHVSHPLD